MNVSYLAPCDAANLQFPTNTFDYHISHTVLEHIPPDDPIRIFREGSRVLKDDGLFVHCIDFSDHFSHGDSSISSVNFLQFDEVEWRRLSGNRFMYHNRMRLDEFEELIRRAQLDVRVVEPMVDAGACGLLERKPLPLDPRFEGKASQVNAASHAWLVAGVTRSVALSA